MAWRQGGVCVSVCACVLCVFTEIFMNKEEPQGTIPMTMTEKLPWWREDDKGKGQVKDDDNSDHECGDDDEEVDWYLDWIGIGYHSIIQSVNSFTPADFYISWYGKRSWFL